MPWTKKPAPPSETSVPLDVGLPSPQSIVVAGWPVPPVTSATNAVALAPSVPLKGTLLMNVTGGPTTTLRLAAALAPPVSVIVTTAVPVIKPA